MCDFFVEKKAAKPFPILKMFIPVLVFHSYKYISHPFPTKIAMRIIYVHPYIWKPQKHESFKKEVSKNIKFE